MPKISYHRPRAEPTIVCLNCRLTTTDAWGETRGSQSRLSCEMLSCHWPRFWHHVALCSRTETRIVVAKHQLMPELRHDNRKVVRWTCPYGSVVLLLLLTYASQQQFIALFVACLPAAVDLCMCCNNNQCAVCRMSPAHSWAMPWRTAAEIRRHWESSTSGTSTSTR